MSYSQMHRGSYADHNHGHQSSQQDPGIRGDFFHVEGAYGHAQMAWAVTAEVLAEKVEDGYLKENEVEELMERILNLNGTMLFSHR